MDEGEVQATKAAPDPAILAQLTPEIPSPLRGFPSMSSGPSAYKPLPYTFRVPNVSGCPRRTKGVVKCPPFYIQLDHALAVIWSLFSTEENDRPLGVVQLQWALNFLKSLSNQQGKNTEDIAVCINAMEEALIEQYAEMVSSVKTRPENYDSCYGDVAKKDIPQRESLMVTEKLPFSVNYAALSKYRPNHLEQIFTSEKGVSMSDVDIKRELDRLERAVSAQVVSEGQIVSGQKENMVELLKKFRKEQIFKIQEELKRLHSIETFIGNINTDNFEPYLNTQQISAMSRNSKTSE